MSPIDQAVAAILDVYAAVATGATAGGGGYFYADGKGTLNAVVIDVELLEALAVAAGRPVHGRTGADRDAAGGG